MKMQDTTVRWLAALLVILAAIVMLAAKGGRSTLAPGGQTIAGPASLTFEATGAYTGGLAYFNTSLDVCLTVANGRDDVSIGFIRLGGGSTYRNVGPNEILGLCETGVDRIQAECWGGPCTLQWRLDQMWP